MKPWYLYNFKAYKEKVDDFIVLNEYEWFKNLERVKHEIHQEVTSIIKNKEEFIPYFNHLLDSNSSGWKTITFKTWGIDVPSNLKKCPHLATFLANNTDVLSMAISKLEGNTKINKHRGDTNAIIRCHMGISIPDELPKCGFQVNETQKSWKNLETFGFIDANEHEAWNHTSSDRIILLFDVIRPEFCTKKNSISLKIRAFLLTQLVLLKLPFLFKLPKKVLRIIFYKILIILWILFPIQKKIGVLRKHS